MSVHDITLEWVGKADAEDAKQAIQFMRRYRHALRGYLGVND